MPIGVPRIIYCWGEELPPQWTDIYNFIFRRRMVFLMQYLDDELCNQICGLLINIHMEDRSKELEQKEMQKSAMASPLKSAGKSGKDTNPSLPPGGVQSKNQKQLLGLSDGKKLKKDKSMEDLLSSYGNSLYEEDLAIDENYTLEQYTLQKITLEWLNWNAQFFNYSDEPYLFYLAEILSKDFTNEDTQLWLGLRSKSHKMSTPPPILKGGERRLKESAKKTLQADKRSFNTFLNLSNLARGPYPFSPTKIAFPFSLAMRTQLPFFLCDAKKSKKEAKHQTKEAANLLRGFFFLKKQKKIEKPFLSVKKQSVNSDMSYAKDKFQSTLAPFRSILNLANLIANDKNFSLNNILPGSVSSPQPQSLHQKGKKGLSALKSGSTAQSDLAFDSHGGKNGKELLQQFNQLQQKPGLAKLIGVLASKEFLTKKANTQKQLSVANKVLGQRNLKKEYALDNKFLWLAPQGGKSPQGVPALLASQSKAGKSENQEGGFNFQSAPSERLDKSLSKKSQSGYRSQKQLFSSSSLPLGDKRENKIKALNYLDFDSTNNNQSYAETRNKDAQNRNDYSRKQTKRALQDEESKKVFVIINSFGGSVGNGITVHDALQFIKAGSLTLGLGVAASAASLVLAGGTISERYVTEGCHVMLHQPESAINGQASDIWIDSQEIMKIRLDVAEIYSLSAHRPRHKILRDLDRDFYLTATETIHYGLADEIATNAVMHEIIEMTSKVWEFHENTQQRLLEARDSATSGLDTQTQN